MSNLANNDLELLPQPMWVGRVTLLQAKKRLALWWNSPQMRARCAYLRGFLDTSYLSINCVALIEFILPYLGVASLLSLSFLIPVVLLTATFILGHYVGKVLQRHAGQVHQDIQHIVDKHKSELCKYKAELGEDLSLQHLKHHLQVERDSLSGQIDAWLAGSASVGEGEGTIAQPGISYKAWRAERTRKLAALNKDKNRYENNRAKASGFKDSRSIFTGLFYTLVSVGILGSVITGGFSLALLGLIAGCLLGALTYYLLTKNYRKLAQEHKEVLAVEDELNAIQLSKRRLCQYGIVLTDDSVSVAHSANGQPEALLLSKAHVQCYVGATQIDTLFVPVLLRGHKKFMAMFYQWLSEKHYASLHNASGHSNTFAFAMDILEAAEKERNGTMKAELINFEGQLKQRYVHLVKQGSTKSTLRTDQTAGAALRDAAYYQYQKMTRLLAQDIFAADRAAVLIDIHQALGLEKASEIMEARSFNTLFNNLKNEAARAQLNSVLREKKWDLHKKQTVTQRETAQEDNPSSVLPTPTGKPLPWRRFKYAAYVRGVLDLFYVTISVTLTIQFVLGYLSVAVALTFPIILPILVIGGWYAHKVGRALYAYTQRVEQHISDIIAKHAAAIRSACRIARNMPLTLADLERYRDTKRDALNEKIVDAIPGLNVAAWQATQAAKRQSIKDSKALYERVRAMISAVKDMRTLSIGFFGTLLAFGVLGSVLTGGLSLAMVTIICVGLLASVGYYGVTHYYNEVPKLEKKATTLEKDVQALSQQEQLFNTYFADNDDLKNCAQLAIQADEKCQIKGETFREKLCRRLSQKTYDSPYNQTGKANDCAFLLELQERIALQDKCDPMQSKALGQFYYLYQARYLRLIKADVTVGYEAGESVHLRAAILHQHKKINVADRPRLEGQVDYVQELLYAGAAQATGQSVTSATEFRRVVKNTHDDKQLKTLNQLVRETKLKQRTQVLLASKVARESAAAVETPQYTLAHPRKQGFFASKIASAFTPTLTPSCGPKL